MSQLWLRVQAPFAAFRGFQAGVFRASAPVMPPSTAYGLVLNLAGIEMRDSLQSVTTLIRRDLPKIQIAIGLRSQPERSSIYQQLHSYPVGASGKDLKEKTHGAKFWITPVRREFLTDYNGIIGLQSDDETLFEKIKKGLRGELETKRYGLPFLGDNNFIIDRLEIIAEPPPGTVWYARLLPDDAPRKGSCRLTVGIDRADNSRTTSFLFAPLETAQSLPPETAWTWTPLAP
jgi:CRISPR-associated protein Cas5t